MDDMLLAWCVRLRCGRVVTGNDVGSFSCMKRRNDIVDLWVKTGAGEVHAARHTDVLPVRFDFYVNTGINIEDNTSDQKWKLITIYPDHRLVKLVLPNGRNQTAREEGKFF